MTNALFCNVCGGILTTYETKQGTIEGVCAKGCTPARHVHVTTTETVLHAPHTGAGVIPEDKNEHGFPHTCKQCGYEECEITDLGAQYSDESNVYLYRCLKCNHVERQADGTGNS